MSSASVPATPVVLIDVTGGTVHVNGDLVEHDGTRSLHEVGVHATAKRVAQTLDRPVRAIAIDESARVSLVVHPSGETSDLQVLEEYAGSRATGHDVEPDLEIGAPLPEDLAAPVEESTGEAVDGHTEDDRPLAAVVELRAPAAAAAPVETHAASPVSDEPEVATELGGADEEPESGSQALGSSISSRRSSRARTGSRLGTNTTAAMLAAVAVVLLGAVGSVLLAGGWSGEAEGTQPTPAASRPSSTRSTSPPATVQETPPAPVVAQKVKVSAVGGTEQIRFRIVAKIRPAQALVLVRIRGRAKPVRRLVELEGKATTLTVAGLPAGDLSWTVEVPGVEGLTGTANVTAPVRSQSGSGGSSGGSADSSGGSSSGSGGGTPGGGKPGGGGVDGGLG